MSSSRKLYGAPGPRRHAARCAEALRALRDFLDRRLDSFGPLEDAVVSDAAPVALGAVTRALPRRRRAVELPRGVPASGVRLARVRLSAVLAADAGVADDVLDRCGAFARSPGTAAWHCLASTVRDLLEWGWTHHIPRLMQAPMLLGNFALFAGVEPQAVSDWFNAGTGTSCHDIVNVGAEIGGWSR